MTAPLFDRVALLGIGLIGSSLALAINRKDLAGHVAIYTRRNETLKRAAELELGDSYHSEVANAVTGADLTIFCAPLGANTALAQPAPQFWRRAR